MDRLLALSKSNDYRYAIATATTPQWLPFIPLSPPNHNPPNIFFFFFCIYYNYPHANDSPSPPSHRISIAQIIVIAKRKASF